MNLPGASDQLGSECEWHGCVQGLGGRQLSWVASDFTDARLKRECQAGGGHGTECRTLH